MGSMIGGIKETQEMIDMAGKHNITADIELISADYVNTAMERLEKADVRYRFVIDVANTMKPTPQLESLRIEYPQSFFHVFACLFDVVCWRLCV